MSNPKKAYYVVNQVLFHFEADGAGPIFPRSGDHDDAPSVPTDLLDELEIHNKVKFLREAEKRRAFGLRDAGGQAFALVLLELDGNGPSVAQYVHEMMQEIRRQTRSLEFPAGARKVRLIGVTPNWLSGATQGTSIGIGGPADTPKWIEDPGNPRALKLMDQLACGPARPVIVCILDTVPGNQTAPWAPTFDNFGGVIYAKSSLQINDGGLPIKHGDPSAPDDFMVEHGPVIAGIVHDVAPNAKIYLIQVLNEHAIGSVASMAEGFDTVRWLRDLDENKGIPCIVNCSFVIAAPSKVPPGGNVFKQALRELTPPDLDRDMSNPTQLDANEAVFRSIADLIQPDDSLCGIVAASGNDSAGMRPPYMARYPARLSAALGVGALEMDDSGKPVRAPYSNGPDWQVSEGLMTLGTWRGAFAGTIPVNPNGTVRALPTGYAEWAGTSFAAPVISGLLALLMGDCGLSLVDAKKSLNRAVKGIEPQTGGKMIHL